MGETGDPCGRPQLSGDFWVRIFPILIRVVFLLMKKSRQLTSHKEHPYPRSMCLSLTEKTPSKGPFTPTISRDAIFPCERALSISCMSYLTKSLTNRFGSAPNCYGLTILFTIAARLNLRAINLSRLLPKHDRRAVGHHDLGELRSLFFGTGRKTTSAIRKELG